MAKHPKRSTEILVSEVGGEGVVYDLREHRAHCLNPTAYAVFRQLDGETPVSQITRIASLELGAALEESAVETAIAELGRAGLLAEVSAPRTVDAGRRRALSQMGLTVGLSLAAPAVWSIVAPSVAEAASAVTCLSTTKCSNATIGQCCGTKGGPAMTCNGGSNCGNNGVNSQCRDKVCQ